MLNKTAIRGIQFIIGLRLFREALAEGKINVAEHHAVEYNLPATLWKRHINEYKIAHGLSSPDV